MKDTKCRQKKGIILEKEREIEKTGKNGDGNMIQWKYRWEVGKWTKWRMRKEIKGTIKKRTW